MKVRYMIIAVLMMGLISFPVTLFADEHPDNEVVEDPAEKAVEDISTVALAKGMLDETKITLEGYIVEKVEKNLYIFRDDTGQIDATIDFHVRYGRKLEPDERVRIDVEVCREDEMVVLDVKKLKKLD